MRWVDTLISAKSSSLTFSADGTLACVVNARAIQELLSRYVSCLTRYLLLHQAKDESVSYVGSVPMVLDEYRVGRVCSKGRKEDLANQDTFSIYLGSDFRILSVFDGHGPTGHQLADFAENHITQSVISDLSKYGPLATARVLVDAFNGAHSAAKAHHISVNCFDKFDVSQSGSTATVVVVHADTVSVAWAGDSRCIFASESRAGSRSYKLTELSVDHSASRKDEKRRIEAAGGVCKRLRGDVPVRVFVKGKGTPGLAMTRSIGDSSGEAAGIIPIPEFKRIKFDKGRSNFLVVATDGIWEFLSSQRVVEVVSKFGPDTAREAADAVVHAARIEWEALSPWAIDDMTCIVAWI